MVLARKAPFHLRTDDAREKLQAIDICALLETIKEDATELG